MKSSLIIILGIEAAVVAGLMSRGTADGVIREIINELTSER
jgi:hypothetical protein